MVLTMKRCPYCKKSKGEDKYLCHQCWYGLTRETRTRLGKHDVAALTRLRELYAQIQQDIPLSEIEVAA